MTKRAIRSSMSTRGSGLCFGAFALALSLCGAAERVEAETVEGVPPDRVGAEASIEALGWMVGHWRREGEGSSTEELWLPAEGGLMLGLGRTIKGDRAVGFEYLRIEQRDTGVVYVASPGGQPPTEFPLSTLEPNRVEFENPDHDFPQRILYWRQGVDLCARIEGEMGGQQRQLGWCWSPRTAS